MTTAICFRCKAEKPLELFKRDKRRLSGRSGWCYECNRAWARKNVACNLTREADTWRRSQYGLENATYEQLLRQQSNACAICRRGFTLTPGRKVGKPHIDHDHGTGQIRGLLCHRCNFGLGVFDDRVERLEAAIGYLKQAAASELFVRTLKRKVIVPHRRPGRPKKSSVTSSASACSGT